MATIASWNPDRASLRGFLSEYHPDLGELYTEAIDLLSRDVLSRPRLMLAGHCLRELFNRLPSAMGEQPVAYSDINRPAFELYRAWPQDDVLTDVDDSGDTPRAISAEVFRAARAVAAAAAVGNQNARKKTALVATGQASNLDNAAVARLHKAIEFFRSWTHAVDYSKPDRAMPSAGQIELELQIIEGALLTRLGNLADRARVLRDLIANANRRTSKEAT